MSQVAPIRNTVLLQEVEKPEVSEGGVVMTATNPDRTKPVIGGVVLAVGPRCEILQVGDVVVYQPVVGTPIQHGDSKGLMVYETEILAIVEPEGSWAEA